MDRSERTRSVAYWVLAILLVLVGVFMPRAWYDALRQRPDVLPEPVKGVTLLQLSLVFEGALLIVLALKGWSLTRSGEAKAAITVAGSERAESRPMTVAMVTLVTLLALSLRLFRLDSDLWLDEITPILDYGPLSPLQVIGTYLGTNNHLLNTLLGKLSVAMFGETEWAIRLPAALFGVATVPVLYWVGRLVGSRDVSLAAALLLAVSYHHVFFSQNARGYTAYLFFSLLSSGLLVKGLQKDRVWTWALYVVAMFLNFASLLNAAFVLAGHIVVGAIALVLVRRRGAMVGPLLSRLATVFGLAGLLVFQLYATVLPQVYAITQTLYRSEATGYRLASLEFIQELVRGLSAGFGGGLIFGVLPFLAVALLGFGVLFRRRWALASALALPVLLTMLWLAANRLTFSPRFFLLALPLAILAAVLGLWSCAQFASRLLSRRSDALSQVLAWSLVVSVAVVSLATLPRYYAVPKQAYRASIEYVESQRGPRDVVMVVYLAEKGYRYYGKHLQLKDGGDYFFVRTPEAFDAVLSAHGAKQTLLVTTFPRALRLDLPTIYERVTREWSLIRTFPATVGDGEISVWRSRTS